MFQVLDFLVHVDVSIAQLEGLPPISGCVASFPSLAQPYGMSVPTFKLTVLHPVPRRLPEAEVAYGKRDGFLQWHPVVQSNLFFFWG